MISILGRPLCAMAAAIVSLPALAGAAQIAGTVLNAAGKPLAGARVVISSRPTPETPGAKPFNTIMTTADDGTFEAKNLAVGKYAICPQPPPGSNLLAPCTWEKTAPTVTVTANESVKAPAIQCKQGVVLAVRLEDPAGLIEAAENRPGAGILIAVRAPGGAVMPSMGQQKNNGYTYQIVAPADADLMLSVRSQYLQIDDSRGEAISKAAGATVPVRAKQGSKEPVVTFTVKGGA